MQYSKQQDYLIQRLSAELIGIIVKEQKKSVEQALNILYNSVTFHKICEAENGLYRESAGYNYDILQDELTNGKFGQYDKYE